MELTKEEEFSEWYHKVLEEAGIVDTRYPIKGMIIYRRWGVFIIRQMQRFLEDRLEQSGHEPCIFPVLISEEVLGKETEHIIGFEDQVFWVTHAGRNPLERRLALRPTSETPIYESFSLWIRSYRDLPLKVHQSVAVYRYETKHTRPLIRGREFLWNEGHAAHATAEDAEKNLEEVKRIYGELVNGLLCLPYVVNRRPEWDKFPGAVATYAFDTLMPDGRMLQIATVHNLGQNFSKVFGIQYEDEKGFKQYVWQGSYGPSFGRLLAALISVHGDERGMILPPYLAPVQVVVVPILYKKLEDSGMLLDYVGEVVSKLKDMGVRTVLDDSDKHPGEKYYHWEMLGVPVRIEVGPRDLSSRSVTVVRRDLKQRFVLGFTELDRMPSVFNEITENLRKKADEMFSTHIYSVKTLAEVKQYLGSGMVLTGWCGSRECASEIEKSASILSVGDGSGVCCVCGRSGRDIKVAKTY